MGCVGPWSGWLLAGGGYHDQPYAGSGSSSSSSSSSDGQFSLCAHAAFARLAPWLCIAPFWIASALDLDREF